MYPGSMYAGGFAEVHRRRASWKVFAKGGIAEAVTVEPIRLVIEITNNSINTNQIGDQNH